MKILKVLKIGILLIDYQNWEMYTNVLSFLVFYENDNNSKRISNSVFSTYCGHRDIYLKHKLSMNRINKNKLLFQILYFRALIYKRNRFLLIHKVLQKTDFLYYFKSIIKYYLI